MLVLTFLLLNWHFVHWDEGEILQFGPILKKYVFGIEQKPDQADYMFINVSYDNQLVDLTDEWGFPIGNVTITDRQKLTGFLSNIAKTNNHKGLMCDIRFDLPSSYDSSLQASFDKLENYLVSNHLTDGKEDSTVISVRTAISDYSLSGGAFFKFSYFLEKEIKTTPLVFAEMVDKKTYHKDGPFFTDGESRFLNTFIVDFLIRPFDLFESEKNYFYDNLGNLLYLDSTALAEITKDKIIVIGDFELLDIHETVLGEMPGPLILINAYLNLKREENRLTLLYVLFLFTSFFMISLYLIIPDDTLEKEIRRWIPQKGLANFITNFLGYFIMLLIILSISYFFFGILLNLLWIGIYLLILGKLLSLFQHRKLKKEQIS